MYKRILLASDGAPEGLVALREGALIARAFGSEVFLLIVHRPSSNQLAAGDYFAAWPDNHHELLARGLERLASIGVSAQGKAILGEPTQTIAQVARDFRADLVVVGHRRQSLLDRWWSGASDSYLSDNVGCSVLVARTVVTDEELHERAAAFARD